MNRKVLLIAIIVLAVVALLIALSSKNSPQNDFQPRGEPTVIYEMPKTNAAKGK